MGGPSHEQSDVDRPEWHCIDRSLRLHWWSSNSALDEALFCAWESTVCPSMHTRACSILDRESAFKKCLGSISTCSKLFCWEADHSTTHLYRNERQWVGSKSRPRQTYFSLANSLNAWSIITQLSRLLAKLSAVFVPYYKKPTQRDL